MVGIPDCKLGFGHNANLLISDIASRAPEYLELVYENPDTPDDIKKVIEHYIEKPKEKTMAKAKTETTETKEVGQKADMNLLEKINAIRLAWSQQQIEKEGKGKAGGGSKYDYYKPQQIIEFCLEQELRYNLFSEFKIKDGFCSYVVIDATTGEARNTECPFEIPRKMAASEAQQVGAAMTYHNRRLAMMMYKIEDNSKENTDVLEHADYSAVNIPAPPMPASAPIIPPAPNAPAFVAPPEVPSALVNEPIVADEQIQADEVTDADVQQVASQIKQIMTPPPVISQKAGEPEMTDKQADELIHEQEVNAMTPPPAPKGNWVGGGAATVPPAPADVTTIGIPNSMKMVPPPAPPVAPAQKEKLVNGQTPYIDPATIMSGAGAPASSKNNIEDLYS